MSDAIVVVPCYNEERRLPAATFERFLRSDPGVSLLFVDDGSRDGTLERLHSIACASPSGAEVLSLPANVGKAEAVRAGVLRAFEAAPAYVGYWDADLATPLEAIADFRGVLDGRAEIELVLGARVVMLGRRIERRAPRHYLGRAAATGIALTLGLPVYDTQCGAKLFRASEEMRKIFDEPFLAKWLFDVEMLARFVHARGPAASRAVYELPLLEWADVPGSKVGPSAYLRAVLDLFRIHRRYRPRRVAGGGPGPRG